MPLNPLFNRSHLLQKLARTTAWDVVVIGGGATGLGIAVDAAQRGYKTLLLEQADFAKGTSSRSTKLVHGGVRYLAQGNIPLVYSALQERGRLLQNAPHVVSKRAFIIPCYSWFEKAKYLAGLKLYDALSGKWRFGRSRLLTKSKVLTQLPGLNPQNLKGGILYYDGQFDDARLAINLAQTAIEQGAVVLNYIAVTALVKKEGTVTGVLATNIETSETYKVTATVVINATGVFADAVHQMDRLPNKPLLAQSQGVHLVFDRTFFTAGTALMLPKTADGRVLFAIPWQQQLLVGTTDTPTAEKTLEPVPLPEEIAFILDTLNQVLEKPVTQKDIRSVFAGLRPLVMPQKEVVSTKELARDHKIVVSESGLITIVGGKWTTYRKMATDVLQTILKRGTLPPTNGDTSKLALHGFTNEKNTTHVSVHGSDALALSESWIAHPSLKKLVHPQFPFTEAEVVWAVQNEMARTVEDVLARRLRLLFLDATAAIEAAPRVAQLLRIALNKTTPWEEEQVAAFSALAKQYTIQQAPQQKKVPTN